MMTTTLGVLCVPSCVAVWLVVGHGPPCWRQRSSSWWRNPRPPPAAGPPRTAGNRTTTTTGRGRQHPASSCTSCGRPTLPLRHQRQHQHHPRYCRCSLLSTATMQSARRLAADRRCCPVSSTHHFFLYFPCYLPTTMFMVKYSCDITPTEA